MSISAALEALMREQAPSEAEPEPSTPATSRPDGWSDRLGRETLEPVPDHPGLWREPEASAALCIWCPSPLAEGDLLACEQHQAELGVTPRPVRSVVTVTSARAMTPADLLAIAELRGWEALPFRSGESAGGSEAAWRTFAGWMRDETLGLVLAAVRERWGDTAEQYGQMAAAVTSGATETT